ncbi:MAG: hypothetical protein KAU50_11610 [Candidatus Marinimicrobia bacterium]|nr:hypothetical protein [Candidatus Neomarinimicrobiota bacterium]
MYKSITITLLLTATLGAQVDWYGYYEAEADYLDLPSRDLYLGFNKLRLDLEVAPGDNIRVGADIIYRGYNGQTTLNFMDFMPVERWPVLPTLDTLTWFPVSFDDTTFVDNAFLEIYFPWLDLTLGRQQISPGVGYAWNPTDIFNVKDILDPTYEQTGVEAFQIVVPLVGGLQLAGILQASSTWSHTTQYYQLKGSLGRFDLSGVYSASELITTGLFAADTSFRELAGLNLEGEAAGLGVRGEFALNRIDFATDNLRYEYVLGLDYTTESSLYLMGEYYHNDFGVDPDQVSFDNYISYFLGETHSLNTDYLFAMAMYPLTDLISAEVFSIYNLNDGSLVINPQLTYNIYEDVELTITGSLFAGEETDEFGYQETGLRLRLRAYF